jgi:hypothetical protein
VLQAPRDREAARRVVRDFFAAITEERAEALEALVSPLAWIHVGSHGGRQRAHSFWRGRFSSLDYTALGGQVPYRESSIQTYNAEEHARVEGTGAVLSPHSSQMEPSQIVIRVPIALTQIGPNRLFGDEITFLLSPTDKGFIIHEMWEDFTVP